MALEGSLKDFGLADILQLICFQRKTGVLGLEGKLDRVRLIFIDGNVVGAESKRRTEDNRLGKVLVKKNFIKEEDLQAALEEQRKTGQKLGAALIRLNLIKREVIQEILTTQVTETVVQLFSWKQGTYEFTAQGVPQDKDIQLSLDTQHLLMEGLRIVDELSVIKDRISLNSIFRRKTDDASALSEDEAEIFRQVDGESDVSTLVDLTDLDNYEVSKTLLALLDKGMIEEVAAAPVFAAEAAEVRKGPSPLLRYLPAAGLLVAVLTAALSPLLNRNEFSHRIETARRLADLRTTIETYHIEKGRYPATLEEVQAGADPWGNPFSYQGDERTYFLASAGPDGVPATPDDIY